MADKKLTVQKIKANIKRSKRYSAAWEKAAREDLRFALGDQWKQEDKDILDAQKRPALTFNIIQPLVFLAIGYQRQSRSSIRAFPEGGEDQIKSEIATRLLKKVQQRTKVEQKLSQQFEDGTITGKGFIEPYIDYTNNLINGELQFKAEDGFSIRIDPDSVEYDLSDAGYVVKERFFSRDKLMEMFPNFINKIKDIQPTKTETDEDALISELGIEKTKKDPGPQYPSVGQMEEDKEPEGDDEEENDRLYYAEYWYKKHVPQYLAADPNRGIAQFFNSKAEAQSFLDQKAAEMPSKTVQDDPASGKVVEVTQFEEKQKVIERHVPQIWVAFVIEDELINDIVSPMYPKWKTYPIIPFFAHYTSLAKRALKDEGLAYQGIVRNLKDPQKEKNKRRSQALHHLNTSANSGWLSEEGAWVDSDVVKNFGSSPGVDLQYKKGYQKPERINPSQISQGHLALENEAHQDIKLISGINADMLAMEDKTASGRAIALRQQQGVLILKRIFDNFTWTQEIVGKFILSQLGTLFSVETAAKVLGEQFISENSVTADMISEVLNSSELGEYDISIGEGQESPTIRYANYTLLTDLAGQGYPIPPDIMLEYSDLPDSVRKQIIMRMQQQPPAAPGLPGAGAPKRRPPQAKK
jgi:hypothetical protein